MEVLVRKATEEEIVEMMTYPVITREVSEFECNYDNEETCLIVEGEVDILYGSKSITLTPGDFVVFPNGLSCVKRIKKTIKKHSKFI